MDSSMHSEIVKGIRILRNEGILSFLHRFSAFIKYSTIQIQRQLRLQMGLMWIGGTRIKLGINPPPGIMDLLSSSLEIEERAFARRLPSGVPAIELGSGVGLVSHDISRTLQDGVDHVLVEANSELIPVLQKTCLLNGINGKIINAGYNTREKTISIHNKKETYVHAETIVNGSGPSVSTITLQDILNDTSISNFSLIVDIEGSEKYLLDEWDLVENNCTAILIEYHTGSERIRERIESSDVFQCSGFIGDVYYYTKVG